MSFAAARTKTKRQKQILQLKNSLDQTGCRFLLLKFFLKTYSKVKLPNILAQSICTHYSGFENMGWFATLKKIRSKIWGAKSRVQRAGCKKQGHCYSKREEAACSFLFLNNNDPVFCTLLFAPHILDLIFFSRSQTDPCFQIENSGCRLTGRVSL